MRLKVYCTVLYYIHQ